MKFQGRIRVFVIFSFVLVLMAQFNSVQSSVAIDQVRAGESTSTNTYLPVAFNNYPWVTTFGAQVRDFSNPNVANLAKESGLNWVRIDAFDWSKIEPQNANPSGYNWNSVNEASLKAATERGIKVIAIIRNTPDWAQKDPPNICGAISESALPEFAIFIREVVKRYSVPPYNIKYWEIGNEPDVDPSLIPPDSPFGCWGDLNDPYYGGGYYAEMLNHAYPAIKSADPKAKVGIGGLLLDCDPTFNKKCTSGKFFSGILRNGIGGVRGSNFDFVSFHGYAAYGGPGAKLQMDENDPKWAHRGGVVLGKIDYLRYVMGLDGVDKPIFHTEGALLCPEYDAVNCDPPNSQFYESQADYVVWLYIRNWGNGVKSTIWFTFDNPDWRYGGFLDDQNSPRQSYHALKFLAQILEGATYTGRVLENTSVAGYEFSTNVKKVWVLWSPDEKPHTVILPATAKIAFDKYGVAIALSGNQITVNSPVYIEFPK